MTDEYNTILRLPYSVIFMSQTFSYRKIFPKNIIIMTANFHESHVLCTAFS